MKAIEWNKNYKIGQAVELTAIMDKGTKTFTTSDAWDLCSGTGVVSVDGKSGGYDLDSIKIIEATEPCKCFDEMLEKVRPKIMESIPDDSIDVEIRWQNYGYNLSGTDTSPVNPNILYEHRLAKKDGGHRRNLSKHEVFLTASYCCFCGRKYNR